MGCEHYTFSCKADIARLAENEGGVIIGYSATFTVVCLDCGLPFRFIGLEAGNHYAEPRVSIDGTELRAPIEPATHELFAPRAKYTIKRRGMRS